VGNEWKCMWLILEIKKLEVAVPEWLCCIASYDGLKTKKAGEYQ
jgi:hypothetical protein